MEQLYKRMEGVPPFIIPAAAVVSASHFITIRGTGESIEFALYRLSGPDKVFQLPVEKRFGLISSESCTATPAYLFSSTGQSNFERSAVTLRKSK